jgi:hypothetical protein
MAAEAEIAESQPLPARQKAAQKKVERLRKWLGKMEDLQSGAVADYVCMQTKANKIAVDVDEARANWLAAKEELRSLVVLTAEKWDEPLLRQYVSELPAEIGTKPDVLHAVEQVQKHLSRLAKVVEESSTKSRAESEKCVQAEQQMEVDSVREQTEQEFSRLFAQYQEAQAQQAADTDTPIGTETQAEADGIPNFVAPSGPESAAARREAAAKLAADLKRLCMDSVATIVSKRFKSGVVTAPL